MADTIHIEIVYAEPQRQIARKVEIAATSTVAEAIQASAIFDALLAGFKPAGIAIFGRTVMAGEHLRDGDRIELLRPLLADPKESRRRRARAKSIDPTS